MEEFQIQLYSAGVMGGLERLEKSFTSVRDKLDILNMEREGLTNSWEGPAQMQWDRELTACLNRIEECLKGMEELTGAVNEIAGMLSKTEKDNEALVDRICWLI